MRTAHADSANFARPLVQRHKGGMWQEMEETLAREVSVPVHYAGGQCHLWAWPQDLPSLAAGHVLLDRLHVPGAMCAAQVTEEDQGLRVTLKPVSTQNQPTAESPGHLSAQKILAHMTAFIKAPGLWDTTGCFHRAAMLDAASGHLVRVVEDIGRHNCVDRLAGYAALHDPQGLNPARHVLLISARITASLYHKARRAGFLCMVSRSAVTSGSLEAAAADGVTLVGFCRPDEERLTVFTDKAGRIKGPRT